MPVITPAFGTEVEEDAAGTAPVAGTNRIRVGRAANRDFDVGARFAALNIPQGATINSAVLTYGVKERTGLPQLQVIGDDVDDAPTFSSSSKPTTYTATTASVEWDIVAVNGATTTVDIASVIEEVVGRPGWVSGNAMRLGIMQDQAEPDVYSAGAFISIDNVTDTANFPTRPSLVIDYTAGGDPTSPPTISTTTLPDGQIGVAYSQPIVALLPSETFTVQYESTAAETATQELTINVDEV